MRDVVYWELFEHYSKSEVAFGVVLHWEGRKVP